MPVYGTPELAAAVPIAQPCQDTASGSDGAEKPMFMNL